jgi:UTP--glucose-1-phosphate uridylyltransferase
MTINQGEPANSNPMDVKTLVLPVAGMGKRLRPLTFTTPKNLIPLRGVPLIEHALLEAKDAGIEEVVVVVSPEHKAAYEAYLKEARPKFPQFTFHLREQREPLGNGHAVLQAADVVGNRPFAVRFCDDVIADKEPTFTRLVSFFNRYQQPVLFLERVPKEEVSRYGVVAAEPVPGEPSLFEISSVVEKPSVETAPSNLIIIGGYVLTPVIMERLKELSSRMARKQDALPISDAFEVELAAGHPLYGWVFPGKRLDCGTLEGLAIAEDYLATQRLQALAVE